MGRLSAELGLWQSLGSLVRYFATIVGVTIRTRPLGSLVRVRNLLFLLSARLEGGLRERAIWYIFVCNCAALFNLCFIYVRFHQTYRVENEMVKESSFKNITSAYCNVYGTKNIFTENRAIMVALRFI